jgi:hypothetical protein
MGCHASVRRELSNEGWRVGTRREAVMWMGLNPFIRGE